MQDRFASYWSRWPEETAHGIYNAHRLRNPGRSSSREGSRWPGRAPAAAVSWDAFLAPTPDHCESLPLVHGRPGRAPATQPGGTGPAQSQAANENKISGCSGAECFAPMRGLAETAASGDKTSSISCAWTPTHHGPTPFRSNPTRSAAVPPDPQAARIGRPEQLRGLYHSGCRSGGSGPAFQMNLGRCARN